jgi:asparagine synthase (glutamine-hydrolysing)
MSYLDTNIRLPELLLARLDKMTMAASVEAREPFMDFELAEFALQMNSSFKVKNKTEKYILKKALENILPNNIIYRPKDGFTVPLQQMFANEKLRKFALNKINEFNTFEKIFESDYIHKIFESNSYNEIWILLILSLWWDNYIINYPMFINENGAIVAEFKI